MSNVEIEQERYVIEEEKSLNWENLALSLQKEQPRTRYLVEYKEVKWVLYPDDYFLEYWNMLIILLLLYTATVIPYRMTLQSPDSLSFIIFDTFVDGLYFMDTVFNCFLAYFDSEGSLITSNKKIFKNYLTGWMILDLASSFPAQVIFQTPNNYSKFIRVGRLPRLYRLIKIAKLIRIFKIIKTRSQVLRARGRRSFSPAWLQSHL